MEARMTITLDVDWAQVLLGFVVGPEEAPNAVLIFFGPLTLWFEW